ncbi:hypothetical protein CSUI_004933 [Cystoisospora suis]|uniref:Uncharacterized protein n=1 Tax=Cystoisospora suis TaxID=483139 RepID=A0A2C6KZF3_9APIC|nr:hypothetical protein CSUI_004933 [Cystoisospora suis]
MESLGDPAVCEHFVDSKEKACASHNHKQRTHKRSCRREHVGTGHTGPDFPHGKCCCRDKSRNYCHEVIRTKADGTSLLGFPGASSPFSDSALCPSQYRCRAARQSRSPALPWWRAGLVPWLMKESCDQM